MRMKYIVIEFDNDLIKTEQMFVFSEQVMHNRMRDSLEALRHGPDHKWERLYPKAISAGFTDGVRCWGRSESLNLDSRADLDTALLQRGGYLAHDVGYQGV